MGKYICYCGRMKSAASAFCETCWPKLPAEIKAELKRDFWRGYELAAAALGWV